MQYIFVTNAKMLQTLDGSVSNPVICPVFKTGGRRVPPSPVRSTRTRFRQNKGFSWPSLPFPCR
jgi:hypothetical protein